MAVISWWSLVSAIDMGVQGLLGEKHLCIAEYLVLYKKSKNFYYLFRAACLIIKQRRLLEVVWSLCCSVRYQPSICTDQEANEKLVCMAMSTLNANYPFHYTREQLIETFGGQYMLGQLPTNFSGARSESVVLENEFIIIGEYAEDSARIVIAHKEFCLVEEYYNQILGVRHIHSICMSDSSNSLLVSTGDSKKYLDRWNIVAGRLKFDCRIRRRLAGYTGATILGGVHYFGTDFSSRPNYLETLKCKKYFYPSPSYNMYVVALFTINDRYVLSLNSEHDFVGKRRSISIFDTETESYIYSDFISLDSIRKWPDC